MKSLYYKIVVVIILLLFLTIVDFGFISIVINAIEQCTISNMIFGIFSTLVFSTISIGGIISLVNSKDFDDGHNKLEYVCIYETH